MKWGVRRDPGSDGLVGKSSKSSESSKKPTAKKTFATAQPHKSLLTRHKEKVAEKEAKLAEAKKKQDAIDSEELRKRIERMQLENQYAKLVADRNAANESLGKKMVKNLINTASDNLVRRVGSELGDNTAELLLKQMGVTTKQARADAKQERKNQSDGQETKSSKKSDGPKNESNNSSTSKKSKSEHAKKPKNSQSFSTNDFNAWVKNNPPGADRNSATRGLPERIYKITNL